jgi:hypothetical protein
MISRYAAVATILAALGLSASPSRSDEYPTLNVAQVCHGNCRSIRFSGRAEYRGRRLQLHGAAHLFGNGARRKDVAQAKVSDLQMVRKR